MALTIDATVGGAAANSYVTEAEATAYLAARLNASAYTGAAADSQRAALIEATRELQDLPWLGYRVADTQALAWPRTWVPDPDSPNFAGFYISSTVIPQRVKDATCELALEFLRAGTTDVAALDATDGVVSKRVDVLQTDYAQPSERAHGLARFPRVRDRLRPLMQSSGGAINIVRG